MVFAQGPTICARTKAGGLYLINSVVGATVSPCARSFFGRITADRGIVGAAASGTFSGYFGRRRNFKKQKALARRIRGRIWESTTFKTKSLMELPLLERSLIAEIFKFPTLIMLKLHLPRSYTRLASGRVLRKASVTPLLESGTSGTPYCRVLFQASSPDCASACRIRQGPGSGTRGSGDTPSIESIPQLKSPIDVNASHTLRARTRRPVAGSAPRKHRPSRKQSSSRWWRIRPGGRCHCLGNRCSSNRRAPLRHSTYCRFLTITSLDLRSIADPALGTAGGESKHNGGPLRAMSILR